MVQVLTILSAKWPILISNASRLKGAFKMLAPTIRHDKRGNFEIAPTSYAYLFRLCISSLRVLFFSPSDKKRRRRRETLTRGARDWAQRIATISPGVTLNKQNPFSATSSFTFGTSPSLQATSTARRRKSCRLCVTRYASLCRPVVERRKKERPEDRTLSEDKSPGHDCFPTMQPR